MRVFLMAATAALWLMMPLAGCDSGGGDSPSPGAGDPGSGDDGDDGDDGGDGGDGVAATAFDPASCTITGAGALETSAGELAGAGLTAMGSHLLSSGCSSQLAVTIDDGGCSLGVTLYGGGGTWLLSDGALTVGDGCALAAAEGEYALDAAASTGAVLDAPTLEAGTTEACVAVDGLGLVGLARFTGGGETVEVDLGGLALSGTVHTVGVAEGSCPAAAALCDGLTCGADAYGVECGACADGETCDGGQCASAWCPPPQTGLGTHPGDTLTDVVVYDCDGAEVHLHDLCGAKAGYFNLLAGW